MIGWKLSSDFAKCSSHFSHFLVENAAQQKNPWRNRRKWKRNGKTWKRNKKNEKDMKKIKKKWFKKTKNRSREKPGEPKSKKCNKKNFHFLIFIFFTFFDHFVFVFLWLLVTHQLLRSVHHIFLIFWSKMLQNTRNHEEIEGNEKEMIKNEKEIKKMKKTWKN